MQAVVVASGDLPLGFEADARSVLDRADLVVAADGGLRHCAALGRWPDQLVGDLDSAPPELIAEAQAHGVVVHQHPVDKNETDLELALTAAAAAGATCVSVMAAFGGRLDHELATIAMLASPQWSDLDISATDGRRQLWVVRSRLELELPVGRTVSLVPWGDDAIGVTTTGLQWPLAQATVGAGTTLGVSNVACDPQQSITLARGVVLVVADSLEHLAPTLVN